MPLLLGRTPAALRCWTIFAGVTRSVRRHWGDWRRRRAGCHDAALHYRTPFISGKDSLNNEYVGTDGLRHAIPPTLLISAIGIIEDASRAVTMDLKCAGDIIYLIGETRSEFGGSHFSMLFGHVSIVGARHAVPLPLPRHHQRPCPYQTTTRYRLYGRGAGPIPRTASRDANGARARLSRPCGRRAGGRPGGDVHRRARRRLDRRRT